MLTNDVKLRINVIDQLDAYFFTAKKQSNLPVAKTIKKLHIKKNMHLIYKEDFYKDKQKEIYKLFIQYPLPIMGYLDHSALIADRKENIDTVAYGKNLNQDVKIPSIKKK